MKVTIDQETMIKALQTEPLSQRYFFGSEIMDKTLAISDSNCRVCAVGAVLRNHLKSDLDVEMASGIALQLVPTPLGKSRIKKLLKDHDYLSALSCYFESLSVNPKTLKRVRTLLVKFVQKHFPQKIKVEIRRELVKETLKTKKVKALPSLLPELPKMTALEYMGIPFVDAHIMAEQRWQKRGL